MAKNKDIEVLINEMKKPDATPRKILNLFLEMIGSYDNRSWEHIEKREFDKATQVTDEMNRLGIVEYYLLLLAKEELLSRDDSETYKYMEPHIKSIQKLIETVNAWTAGPEQKESVDTVKMTAYEKRKLDKAWTEDDETSVPVIRVEKKKLPDHFPAAEIDENIPRGTFTNRDTGIEVIYGRRTIEETMDQIMDRENNSILAEIKIAVLYRMQELIENTVCFDHLDLEDQSDGKNNPDGVLIHRLYGLIEYGGRYYLLKFRLDALCDDTDLPETYDFLGRIYRISDIQIIPVEQPFN